MLKENQNKLVNNLKGIIKEVGYMSDIKQEIVAEFKLRNLNGLRAAWAFSENLDLITLTDSEEDIRFLFLFSYSLSKVLKEKEIDIPINVKDYFTELEYNSWIGYREIKESENIYPIVIDNVDEISDRYYQTIMSAQEIERLNAANILIYNPNSQRELKVTKAGLSINVNPKKVTEIAERMSDGKQFADDLKFNILGDPPVYNPKKRTLTIYEGSFINTFDGQHRKEGNALVLSKNPHLKFNWPVKFTAYSEIRTHDCMTQINKQTPIDEEFLSTKDYSKSENLLIDKIMDSRGELSTVTKDTDSYVKENRGLTTKSILAEAIRDNYEGKIEISINRDSVANWIVEFTNYLMGYFIDDFITKPYEVKKHSYINNMNMFYGYIALSAKLQNNSQWKDILKQKIESIDFSKSNSMWKDIGIIGERKINKTIKNKLYKLFTEGL